MAVPKKRTSKQRKLKRRTHQVLTAVAVVKCSHCGASRKPHYACASCGYYDGRAVLIAREQ
ncbi:MAG: 50S ribosomal protein L32 [bacterium]|nr:50S ribosomal protein L32 [bacterium]